MSPLAASRSSCASGLSWARSSSELAARRGAQLLGRPLHLQGQALQLPVQAVLHLLGIGAEPAPQLGHALLHLRLQLICHGRQPLLQALHAAIDLVLQPVGVGAEGGLDALGIVLQPLPQLGCVGLQCPLQLPGAAVHLGAQLLGVGADFGLQLADVGAKDRKSVV